MTPAETVSDLRYRCERIARDLGVPFEAVVQFIAEDLGGVEKYCEDGDYAGPLEVQEKTLAFCRRYVLDRLPPAQRDAVGYMAQRRNTFGRRTFMDAAEPIMRRHHIQPSGWDAVIQAALHIPGLLWLHQYTGSLDQAIDDLSRYLTERTPAMVDQQLKTRTEQINECLNGHFSVLGINDKTKQRTHTRNALKGTIPDVASGNDQIEAIVAQIDAYFAKVKEGKDELAAHGLGKRPEPPADAQTPLFGMNAKAAADARPKVDFKNEKLEEWTVTYHAGSTAPQSGVSSAIIEATNNAQAVLTVFRHQYDDPAIEVTLILHAQTQLPPRGWDDLVRSGTLKPAAPPVTETPSAGDAIPEIGASPASAPAVPESTAKIEPPVAPPVEPQQLYFKLDYVLDDTTTYTLEAKWSKETGDVWLAKAIVKGSEPDERTRPLIVKDVETNLKARRAVEVVLDIEYEPTVEEINAVKNRCYELAKKTYPDMAQDERLQKIKESWGGKIARDAIAVWGTQGAYDKVHQALAQLEDTPPNAAEQSASELFPGMVSDVIEETPKTLAVVDKPQALQQTPAGANNLGFRMPNSEQWAFIVSYADFAIRSGFYPGVKDKNQAIVVMVQGFTLGVDPVSSLRGIDPIPSKRGIQLCFRAKLAKALVMRTGYCEKFVVVGDATRATATVKRKGHPENVFTFTHEDAKTAKLIDRNPDVWNNYTAKMLKNRVITEAVSVEFPEVYFAFSAAVEDDDEEDAA